MANRKTSPETVTDAPLAAQLADRYRVDSELGRGGMATVFLAEDLRHRRRVALKVLHPGLGAVFGPERFLREIQLTAQLAHPNILAVFDSGENAGHLWYAMPYADGQSLRTRIRAEGPLPLDDALRITREIGAALSYAHAAGVVHRDIKPENILFAKGRALVADFGIARNLENTGAQRLTETGISVGTPAYMSPEQALGDSRIDARTDQYALACVLYEMLTGEPPFDGPNARSIIAKRLAQPAPSLRTLRDTAPEGVERAVTVALSRLPADRFASVAEFVDSLSTADGRSRRPSRFGTSARGVRRVAVALSVVGLAALTTNGVLRAGSAVPAAATVIAVLPFTPATADTALHRLGLDLAGTVSASLDGVGEIRTVDRLTVLAQVREGAAALTLEEAAELGRRLGATSVVHGSLSRDGARVRLDAGLFNSADRSSLGRSTVVAAADSLSALTDSVVWKLLEDIWKRGEAPTPTLEAVTTRSLPALRAYLDGEKALVAGRGEEARSAFRRAIAADSTFWFAYYRYNNAMGWVEGEADSAATNIVWNHRHELPNRERLLVEATHEGTRIDSGYAWQYRRLQEIVSRYPDYLPAWWVLADGLVHVYPNIGSSMDDARVALERVVTLNPAMVYAWAHLSDVYSVLRDSTALAHALDMVGGPGPRELFRKTERQDRMLMKRTELALLRGTSATDAFLDSMFHHAIDPSIDPTFSSLFLLWPGHAAPQIRLNERLLRHALSRDRQETVLAMNAVAWAMRGAWDSALVTRDRLSHSEQDSAWVLATYRMAALGAWLGELPVAEAERRREAALRLAPPTPADSGALIWLDGVLAFARRDRAGLSAARAALKRTGAPRTADLDQSLGSFDAALNGDLRTAARSMAALEERLGDRRMWIGLSPNVLLRGVNRLAAAEWLLATGDSARAARLLTWHEPFSGPFLGKFELSPYAYLLRARIADGHGDARLARRSYEQFLVRYDMPNAAHRGRVDEARAALARLTRR